MLAAAYCNVTKKRRAADVYTSCVGQSRPKSHSRPPVAGVAPVHRQQRVQVLPQVVGAAECDRHHRRHHAGDAGRRRQAALLSDRCLCGGRLCSLHLGCSTSSTTLGVLNRQTKKDTAENCQLGLSTGQGPCMESCMQLGWQLRAACWALFAVALQGSVLPLSCSMSLHRVSHYDGGAQVCAVTHSAVQRRGSLPPAASATVPDAERHSRGPLHRSWVMSLRVHD